MNHEQLSFKFFWPLTEQIPLELDYTESVKYSNLLTYPLLNDGTTTGFSIGPAIGFNTPTWTTSVNVDTNGFTITSKNKPPLYRRVLFKLLGINWKQS
jgi:hypothetical protein